jgi:hypothetical protein
MIRGKGGVIWRYYMCQIVMHNRVSGQSVAICVPSDHDHPKIKGIKHRPSRTGLAWVHAVLLSPLDATVKGAAASSILPIKNINKPYEAAAASGAASSRDPNGTQLGPPARNHERQQRRTARQVRPEVLPRVPGAAVLNAEPRASVGKWNLAAFSHKVCRLRRQKKKCFLAGKNRKKIGKKLEKKLRKNREKIVKFEKGLILITVGEGATQVLFLKTQPWLIFFFFFFFFFARDAVSQIF